MFKNLSLAALLMACLTTTVQAETLPPIAVDTDSTVRVFVSDSVCPNTDTPMQQLVKDWNIQSKNTLNDIQPVTSAYAKCAGKFPQNSQKAAYAYLKGLNVFFIGAFTAYHLKQFEMAEEYFLIVLKVAPKVNDINDAYKPLVAQLRELSYKGALIMDQLIRKQNLPATPSNAIQPA